jgi:WD40 repeat protein
MDVVFSPDGYTILSASQDATLIQWDMETGAILRRFVGHRNEARSVAFSPDGGTAVSVSTDSTIIVWDIASGQGIRRYLWPQAGNIFSVAFSQDGHSILAAGGNGVVSLWRIDPTLDDLLGWIDGNRFVPSLTCTQRQIYDLKPLCETTDP